MAKTTEAKSIDPTAMQPAREPHLYMEAVHLKAETVRIGMAVDMTVELAGIGSLLELGMHEASKSRAH
jgi:hypothetical protein